MVNVIQKEETKTDWSISPHTHTHAQCHLHHSQRENVKRDNPTEEKRMTMIIFMICHVIGWSITSIFHCDDNGSQHYEGNEDES